MSRCVFFIHSFARGCFVAQVPTSFLLPIKMRNGVVRFKCSTLSPTFLPKFMERVTERLSSLIISYFTSTESRALLLLYTHCNAAERENNLAPIQLLCCGFAYTTPAPRRCDGDVRERYCGTKGSRWRHLARGDEFLPAEVTLEPLCLPSAGGNKFSVYIAHTPTRCEWIEFFYYTMIKYIS